MNNNTFLNTLVVLPTTLQTVPIIMNTDTPLTRIVMPPFDLLDNTSVWVVFYNIPGSLGYRVATIFQNNPLSSFNPLFTPLTLLLHALQQDGITNLALLIPNMYYTPSINDLFPNTIELLGTFHLYNDHMVMPGFFENFYENNCTPVSRADFMNTINELVANEAEMMTLPNDLTIDLIACCAFEREELHELLLVRGTYLDMCEYMCDTAN